MTLTARGEDETMALAARLAKRTGAGTVVCLRGALGAGKTTFVRGFLRGLGHRGAVPSPTFALINEYPKVKPRVYHVDLYRLEDGELAGLGLEEYLSDAGAVSLIEWPEIAGRTLPKDRIEVELSHARRGRLLKLRGLGPRSRAILRRAEGK